MKYLTGHLVLELLLYFVPVSSQNYSCHTCLQVNNHDECNLKTELCLGTEQVCVTKIEKLDSIGKVYTKGCLSSRICSELEDLNRDYICLRTPSTCFYCCLGNLCNKYNMAPDNNITPTVNSVIIFLSFVCVFGIE